MRLKSSYIVIIYISFAEGEFDAVELYSRIVYKIQEGYVNTSRQNNMHLTDIRGWEKQRNRASLPEQPVGEEIFIRCLELIATCKTG